MKTARSLLSRGREGIVLIISMVFVITFAVLGIAFCSVSGTNVKSADNQRRINCALANAESGLDIVKFWLDRVSIPGTTSGYDRINVIASSLLNDLADNDTSNIMASYSDSTITIPAVTLDLATAQSFSAQISQPDSDTVQVDVIGSSDPISRSLRVTYNMAPRTDSAFDYGIATRGPLQLAGNVELEGINISVESSVFIDTDNGEVALSVTGNSQIAGDVSISDPDAQVELQGGQCSIGGETGDDAMDHVFLGVPPPEFPTPEPAYFEHYAITTIDDGSGEDVVLENIRIPAGLNPTFSGNTTIKGVVFVEQPNIVTFAGNCQITGVIVGDGDIDAPSCENQINFLGTVDSYDVSTLPFEPQFAGIRSETGTFLMAPGFSASFGGNFSALSGAVAASGITFTGNAGGTINGSVINYSDEPMVLQGNSDLTFNRSEAGQVPVGFIPEIVLHYQVSSYSEVLL